jgi:multiple sugar transport system permease protein
MAFPAEIAMIPAFLLLKQLNLLNTYLALILPNLVNGFYVFLLKGFFDSLPQELFEVAELEGASEARVFLTVVIPLCLPIFAVIALFAFTFAYGSFMWAFIVCQNPELWTIMVFLYELQMYNPEYLVMTALTLASLPPLIVFILAQRIIMRGIRTIRRAIIFCFPAYSSRKFSSAILKSRCALGGCTWAARSSWP